MSTGGILQEKFERLLACLSSPLRELTLVAYYICMRQGEILKLTWDKVDLERAKLTKA